MFVVDSPAHWVFEGTGLALGDVLQGLLEIHCISGRERYVVAVRRTAEELSPT